MTGTCSRQNMIIHLVSCYLRRVASVGWQGVGGGSSGSLGDAVAAAAEVEELVGGPGAHRGHPLHVGTLHYVPQCEPFPLLAEPNAYEPNTFDIVGDPAERAYWCRGAQCCCCVEVV